MAIAAAASAAAGKASAAGKAFGGGQSAAGGGLLFQGIGRFMEYRAQKKAAQQHFNMQEEARTNIVSAFQENTKRANIQLLQERDQQAEQRRLQRIAAQTGLGMMETRNSASGARGNSFNLTIASVYSDLARQANINKRNDAAMTGREDNMFNDMQTSTNNQLRQFTQTMESPSFGAMLLGVAPTAVQAWSQTRTGISQNRQATDKQAAVDRNTRRGY